jgi:hypothetical protein
MDRDAKLVTTNNSKLNQRKIAEPKTLESLGR